jgi:hypothetical protein
MSVVWIRLANFQSALSSPTNRFPITDHTLFVNGRNLGTVESLAGVNWSGGLVQVPRRWPLKLRCRTRTRLSCLNSGDADRWSRPLRLLADPWTGLLHYVASWKTMSHHF